MPELLDGPLTVQTVPWVSRREREPRGGHGRGVVMGWRATLNTWSSQMHGAFIWQCHVRCCQDLEHFRWSNQSQRPSISLLFPTQCLCCTAGILKPWNPPSQMPDSAVSDSKITHPKCHWLKPSLGAHPKVQRVRNKHGVLFIDGHVNYEFDF